MSAATKRSGSGRLKGLSILAVVVLSALVFLAWSQSWGHLDVTSPSGAEASLDVPGATAAPALAALGLAGLALAAALAIAGPLTRIVLGAIDVLLGASIAISGFGSLVDPVAAGAAVVTKATGVAGLDSIRAVVTGHSAAPWAAVTIALGILLAMLGVVVAVTTSRWPQSGRRFQSARLATEEGVELDADALFELAEAADAGGGTAAAQTPDEAASRRKAAAVDDWDSLSRGEDPTS